MSRRRRSEGVHDGRHFREEQRKERESPLLENPKEKGSDKEGQDKMGWGSVSLLYMCLSMIGSVNEGLL